MPQFEIYVAGVRANAQAAPVLATRLENAAPGDLTPDERRMLKLVIRSASEVSSVVSERERLSPARLRPLMLAVTTSHNGLESMLSMKAGLPADVAERAPLAARVHDTLYPNGVVFLMSDADSVWSESHRLLTRIDDEKLEHAIHQLGGDEFLAAIRKATDVLGDAIGTGHDKRVMPSSTALQEALVRFGRAVGAYCRMLAAHCDEEDPGSVARFMSAVAPIDEHRAGQRGTVEDTTTTESPAPAPETPTTPAAPTPSTETKAA